MPAGTQPPTSEDLEEALRVDDHSAAVVAGAALVASGQADAALQILARHVAASGEARDRTTVELLVETLDASGTIVRMASSMLLDRAAVDDVSQESLISILRSIGSYRGESAFTTWVYPIVKRRVADHLRGLRDSAPLDEQVLPSARMSSMIATRATVQRTLAQLPELYRVPVTLRDLEAMTYAEIAERLGRNVGTVKAQVSRGRAMVAGTIVGDDALGAIR